MIGLLLVMGLTHLGPMWQTHADALRSAEHFALVRIVVPTKMREDQPHTSVEVLDTIAGTPPAAMNLIQKTRPIHHFKYGQLALLPLAREGKQWLYLGGTPRPMLVERNNRRPAVAFVKRWRARPAQALEGDLDYWLDLLGHPTAIARRLSYFALLGQAAKVEALMNNERIERLAAPLTQPEIPDAEAYYRVRMLAALAGRAGASRLAASFDRLSNDNVRRAAVMVLGQYPTTAARATLKRCAADASGSLQRRCVRSLRKLSSPPP